MLLAPGTTLNFLVVAVLLALLLGLLVVLLVGVPLGRRARYAIGGGAALLGGIGVFVLVFEWSWLPTYRKLIVEGELAPKAVANAAEYGLPLVVIVIVGLTLAIAKPWEWHLADRVATFVVTLLAGGFSSFPAVPGLLPIGDFNLAKTAALSLGLSVGLPLLVLSSVVIAWRPWSAYGLGLLIVAGSIQMSFTTFIKRHQLAYALGDPVAILGMPVQALFDVLIFVGAAMTLFGNLWHPAQWVAAGAGIAAVATSLMIPITDSFVGAALYFGGMLTVMFVPRLIGSYVKAREAW